MNYERIILELMNRVSLLEEELQNLKIRTSNNLYVNEGTGRDTTKYILDGKRYGKSRLVLSIIRKYMIKNPNISAEKLATVFDKSLQGSLGVIRTISDAKNSYSDYERRFFCKNEEIIKTTTSDCVVCSQWGIDNINNIIVIAKELEINVITI